MARWPIFVISLSDAVERRKPLLAQLRAFSLDFELFDAIDGRNGLPGPFEGQVDRQKTRLNMGRDMSDGEYACALSHLAIYRLVLDRSLPGAIVLEDDAILQPAFEGFYCGGAYSKADLISFDFRPARIWLFSNRRLTDEIEAGRLSMCPALTTGYSITAAGCAYILENSFPLSRTADWPCDITRIGALATIPRIVDHPPDDLPGSEIESARRVTVESGYRGAPVPQSGGFETRKWKRSIIKRLSRPIS
jgi:glycosyl transferase family 25